MNDDWRLHVRLHEDGMLHKLVEELEAAKLDQELDRSFHDQVVLSVDGSQLFCYAGSRREAEDAERLIRSQAAVRGWDLECELRHWHPTAEEWKDPDDPLPHDDAELAAERAERIAREREESLAQGYPEYEVRVECPSHGETVELSQRLREEGIPNVQRWRFLVVGAPDEDSANALAQRLRREAPEGSVVTPEGTLGAVLADQRNAFAIFGGLGG